MKPVVDRKTAEQDVNTWLDKQRVKPRVRAEKAKQADELTKAIMYGECRINDDGCMVQALSFPIGNLTELVFSSRIQLDDVRTKTKSIGSDDAFSVIAAYVSSSTGIGMGTLKDIDNADMALASDIMAFF